REARAAPRVVEAAVVHAQQVHHDREGERRLVAQLLHYAGKIARADLERELPAIQRLLADALAQDAGERGLQRGDVGHQRLEMVAVRLILFCSWIKPYNRPSAEGGQP